MAGTSHNHVVVWMNFLKDSINKGDTTVLGILTAVIIIFLTIVIFGLRKRGNNRRGVLILGVCDAGKTVLFSRLVNKTYKQTFTSISSNSGSYIVPDSNKSLNMIDVPGHERIRLQVLEGCKANARGILYVVDSSTVQKEIKDIAEYLYTVLCDSTISSNCPPILVVCNKQDQTFAKGATVVQAMLEKEMNTLRVTRSAALQDLSTSGNNNTYLGKRNKDFSFADLKPLRLEFAECSAQGKKEGGEPELNQVSEWLSRVA